MCTLHILKNISCELISYNAKLELMGFKEGLLNIKFWIVFETNYKVVWLLVAYFYQELFNIIIMTA